jgi:glycosyltransferase involved in cell wall biosynthesis
MTGRVAFVPPRFGAGVVGGAEAVCREVALGLAARGWEVEVLTTCATDHYTWNNELPEGTTEEEGLVVRRFKMIYDATRPGWRAQQQIQAGIVPPLDDQLSWVSWRFQVPGLFHWLLREGHRYDAVVFAPYLFWTSTVCLPIVAERAIAMPCLHDETYARMDVMRPVLGEAASVWFLSEPEHQLAHRLGPVAGRHQVVGAGLDVPSAYDPEGFRRRHGLTRPFILYAGRREPDKGWPWLMECFERAIRLGGVDVDLVTAGVGDVEVPAGLTGRVVDLGFLPATERDDAFAAAIGLAQPSRMESFSRVVMEAWLAGTPVLAVANSEVVAWHCERSGGGLTFTDEFDLAACLRWLTGSPDEAAAMAERGRRYVLDTYRWPVVLDRMEADLLAFRQGAA